MAYNAGVSTLFNKPVNTNSAYADSINPTFSFSGSINSLFGTYIDPIININSTGSIVNLYCQSVTPTINIGSGTITQLNAVNVIGPQALAGNISNAYSLYVNPFSGSGTVLNNFTAYFEGSVGIGTTTPVSALDVAGTMSVGTYAGAITSTVSQFVISGALGIATATPSYLVDVNGIAAARQMFSPQTTRVSQMAQLASGFDQNIGGGMPGMNKGIGTFSCSIFSVQTSFPSLSGGFGNRTYDGRYVYLASGNSAILTRYDTFLPFSSSVSYQTFDVSRLIGASVAAGSALGFDGMFVYQQVGVIYFIKYNTSLSFTNTNSYQVFNLTALNASVSNAYGTYFDGTYLYISPRGTPPSLIRYNINLPFSLSSSYQVFLNPPSSIGIRGNNGYGGGTFDGRYMYFVPQSTATGAVYNAIRYDTFATFAVSASYTTFNLVSLGGNTPVEMNGLVFTGRYVYFCPFNATTIPGQLIQYDTTLPFTSASSYAIFNITPYYTSGASPIGTVFDGRFLYLLMWNTQTLVRYDTLLPFTASTSYLFANLSQILSAYTFSVGGTFDGRYLYQAAGSAGVLVRIDTYCGPQATYLNAFSAPQGLTLLNGGSFSLVNTSTSGSAISGTATVSAVPSQVANYLVVNINGTSRKIPFYNM